MLSPIHEGVADGLTGQVDATKVDPGYWDGILNYGVYFKRFIMSTSDHFGIRSISDAEPEDALGQERLTTIDSWKKNVLRRRQREEKRPCDLKPDLSEVEGTSEYEDDHHCE
jgi:hypothetical protein